MATTEINQIGDFEEIADPRNDLAVERTELALERTHLAWIRTLFTLITAGIAIDKGIEFIHERRVLSGDAMIESAHIIGITLTSIGSIMLLLQSVTYMIRSYQLARMKKGRFHYITTTIFLSFIVFLLGSVITYFLIIDPYSARLK
jgi:putative membrane protein